MGDIKRWVPNDPKHPRSIKKISAQRSSATKAGFLKSISRNRTQTHIYNNIQRQPPPSDLLLNSYSLIFILKLSVGLTLKLTLTFLFQLIHIYTHSSIHLDSALCVLRYFMICFPSTFSPRQLHFFP